MYLLFDVRIPFEFTYNLANSIILIVFLFWFKFILSNLFDVNKYLE